MARYGRDGWRTLAGAAILAAPVPAWAQDDTERPDDEPPAQEIVVTGKRPPGSALGNAAPVAMLDAEAIRAMGVTSIEELLKLRDRNGAVPFRFQPAFLDPYGRIVRLSVRKLF